MTWIVFLLLVFPLKFSENRSDKKNKNQVFVWCCVCSTKLSVKFQVNHFSTSLNWNSLRTEMQVLISHIVHPYPFFMFPSSDGDIYNFFLLSMQLNTLACAAENMLPWTVMCAKRLWLSSCFYIYILCCCFCPQPMLNHSLLLWSQQS